MADKKVSALGKKKEVVAPTKQTMNFVHIEKKVNPLRIIITVLVIALLAAAAVKFGILDQEQKKVNAYNELSLKQTQLAALSAKLVEYDELAAQYGRYSYGWMNEKETGLVGRIDVLDLLEKNVMTVATVQDLSITDNVLTMNISGVTLERASEIVKQLESSPIVSSASVYSASAAEAAEASIFMSIVLTKEVA